ncbi:unnamed protein product, partial [Protopolystoma xenopodis]
DLAQLPSSARLVTSNPIFTCPSDTTQSHPWQHFFPIRSPCPKWLAVEPQAPKPESEKHIGVDKRTTGNEEAAMAGEVELPQHGHELGMAADDPNRPRSWRDLPPVPKRRFHNTRLFDSCSTPSTSNSANSATAANLRRLPLTETSTKSGDNVAQPEQPTPVTDVSRLHHSPPNRSITPRVSRPTSPVLRLASPTLPNFPLPSPSPSPPPLHPQAFSANPQFSPSMCPAASAPPLTPFTHFRPLTPTHKFTSSLPSAAMEPEAKPLLAAKKATHEEAESQSSVCDMHQRPESQQLLVLDEIMRMKKSTC